MSWGTGISESYHLGRMVMMDALRTALLRHEADLLARTDGFTSDGETAGDYLAAGCDPKLPRYSMREIKKTVEKLMDPAK